MSSVHGDKPRPAPLHTLNKTATVEPACHVTTGPRALRPAIGRTDITRYGRLSYTGRKNIIDICIAWSWFCTRVEMV